MVEEAFSEETEVLGVSLVLPTVELKDADSLVFFFWIFVSESTLKYLFSKKKTLPVNFVPWRTSHSALSQMILQRSQALHKAQAILA